MFHGETTNDITQNSSKNVFLTSLVVSQLILNNFLQTFKNITSYNFQSGAAAGLFCDIIFFPLDTLRTRLQSQHGFIKSGGYKRLYQGIAPVIIGSAPTGKVFEIDF